MTQDVQPKPEVDALLRDTERRQSWLQDARQFHTKNLFGFWLLLILAGSVVVFVMLLSEEFSLLLPVSALLIFLVIVTGAYVFQEAARVHRRIDAILKLFEEKEQK